MMGSFLCVRRETYSKPLEDNGIDVMLYEYVSASKSDAEGRLFHPVYSRINLSNFRTVRFRADKYSIDIYRFR